MIISTAIEKEFLRESNSIEGVYDDGSLVQAVLAWEYLKAQEKMTHYVVCKTHKILMLDHNLYPNERGYYRRRPVYIGGQEGMNPIQIEGAMKQWLLNVNDGVTNGKKETDIWKEKICKLHHIQYEQIHPFIDGNGRTGRMFMNWERLKLGLDLLVIHEGQEQSSYYEWFK